MFINRYFILLVIISTCVTAQEITLRGHIRDSKGAYLRGATVMLKSGTQKTVSGDKGYFSFSSLSSGKPLQKNPDQYCILKKGILEFTINNKEELVVVEIFRHDGKRIALAVNQEFKHGEHARAIFKNVSANVFCLVRVRIGSFTKVFQLFSHHGSKVGSLELPVERLSKRFVQRDSLIVKLSGYYPVTVAISSLHDSLEIVLPDGPSAGYTANQCAVPQDAKAISISKADHVIGNGTPQSCTPEVFINAVAQGGSIVFNCGADPVTITLDKPAKVFNNKNLDIVIDGGNKITLSGGGKSRILYMNTCDKNQVWTTPSCANQDHPRLTVQNITFVDGNSRGDTLYDGGGAIWVRGGRFKIVNCRFFNNTCDSTGPDVGGAAVRVLSQYQGLPVYVVNSTFGGDDGFGNFGSNGGGVSSIGVSWSIINCLFTHNRAIGNGANPAAPQTPGGGSGGAIYNDGKTMTLSVCGTLIESNKVNAHGSAIFFVSNDHTGNIRIEKSIIRNNIGGSWYPLPGISMHPDTKKEIISSVIE